MKSTILKTVGKKVKRALGSKSIALNTTANISKTLTDMGVKPTYKNFKKYVNSPTFRKKFNKRAESNRKAIRNFEPKGMVIKFN